MAHSPRTAHKLTDWQESARFANWLKASGWQWLGGGSFGAVYSHPRFPNVVLKKGHRADRWLAYMEWAVQTGWAGVFAPKVYGVRQLSEGMGYVALMERLVDAYAGGSAQGYRNAEYLERAMSYRTHKPAEEPTLIQCAMDCFAKQYVHRFGWADDIAAKNYGFRPWGDVPVVFDPMADSHSIDHGFTAIALLQRSSYLPKPKPKPIPVQYDWKEISLPF